MNKTTRPVTNEEFDLIISTIEHGYTTAEGVKVKPNPRVAMCLCMQRSLGLRIGDVVHLKLNDFHFQGGKCRIKIVEGKTKKLRDNYVNSEIYNLLMQYCLQNNIRPDQEIFGCSTRLVQHFLQQAINHLGLQSEGIGSHSFRKALCTEIYKSTNDLLLVSKILMHSDPKITQRYIGFQEEEIESAFDTAMHIPTTLTQTTPTIPN